MFIEVIILLDILLFNLQNIFEHLVIIMINPLKYLNSFGFALFIPFSFHLMMGVQLAPVMMVYRQQIRLLWRNKFKHSL
jgi:hypothetical protein